MQYSSKRYNSQPNQIHLERPLSYSKHWWTMSWVKDNQINWVLKISCSSHKILNFYSTNISLSQSHSLKVSALVLSSTQSRIVSLYKIFCSWMKSLFWSYPLPRTEQDLISKTAKVCSTTIRLLGLPRLDTDSVKTHLLYYQVCNELQI